MQGLRNPYCPSLDALLGSSVSVSRQQEGTLCAFRRSVHKLLLLDIMPHAAWVQPSLVQQPGASPWGPGRMTEQNHAVTDLHEYPHAAHRPGAAELVHLPLSAVAHQLPEGWPHQRHLLRDALPQVALLEPPQRLALLRQNLLELQQAGRGRGSETSSTHRSTEQQQAQQSLACRAWIS